MAIVAPPSPKRAKNKKVLERLLHTIRSDAIAAGFEANVRPMFHRHGNLYGYVQAHRKIANGCTIVVCAHLFYDGTSAAEVERWTPRPPGKLRGGVLRSDAPLECTETYAAPDLPAALAWT